MLRVYCVIVIGYCILKGHFNNGDFVIIMANPMGFLHKERFVEVIILSFKSRIIWIDPHTIIYVIAYFEIPPCNVYAFKR